MNIYHVHCVPTWNANYTKTEFRYGLKRYIGSGSSMVNESNETWPTKLEAELAGLRANAGNMTGITFSSYSDD
jgi:hypothetical protein